MGCDIHCYVQYRHTRASRERQRLAMEPMLRDLYGSVGLSLPRMKHKDAEPERWQDFGGRINPGRNYHLFGRMAGVRGDGPPVVAPRGIPDDLAWYAKADWWLRIDYLGTGDGEGECTPADAERYARHGRTRGSFEPYIRTTREGGVTVSTVVGAEHRGKPTHVEHPDWHTPSWLTSGELAVAIADDPEQEPEYRALLAAMRQFEADEYEVRLVFWFDN